MFIQKLSGHVSSTFSMVCNSNITNKICTFTAKVTAKVFESIVDPIILTELKVIKTGLRLHTINYSDVKKIAIKAIKMANPYECLNIFVMSACCAYFFHLTL